MTTSRGVVMPAMIAITLASCSAAKPIVTDWRNPAYISPLFKRIMVGSLSEQASVRRNLEDEFANRLKAAGIDALPSYRYLSEGGKIDEPALKEAAKKAGADAVILVRPTGVEKKTEYGPGYYPYPAFGFFGRHIGAFWSGFYGAPTVHRYDVYTSEITLGDVTKDDVVWSGSVRTLQSEHAKGAIKSYVETVMKALNEKNLLEIKK